MADRSRFPFWTLHRFPMGRTLTLDDARQSLTAHVATKGDEIREKHGPAIGWEQLLRILEDGSCVRYPCELRFDAGPLLPGEFAHPVANGDRPEDGFTLHVHPLYATQLPAVPYLVLYQLVLVNYGEFASPEDAETFGSHALGLDRETYYQTLCELADQLEGEPACA
jgi:hypothetical protein